MPELPVHIRFLMAVMLTFAANEFGNHGCNDFDLGKYMTPEQGKVFMQAYHEWNGDPEEWNPDEYNGLFSDDAIMGMMAHMIYPEGDVAPFLPD